MSLFRPLAGLVVVAVAAVGLGAPVAQAAPGPSGPAANAVAKSKAKPKPKPKRDPLANARKVATYRIGNDLSAVRRWRAVEATAPRFDRAERVALVRHADAAITALYRDLAAVPTARTAAALDALVVSAHYSNAAVKMALDTYWVTEPPLTRLANVEAGLELLANQVADLPEGSDPTAVNQAIDDALDAASHAHYKVDMARSTAVSVPGAPTRAQLIAGVNGTRYWLGWVNSTVSAAEDKLALAQEAYITLTDA